MNFTGFGMDELFKASENFDEMMKDVDAYTRAVDEAAKNYAPSRFETLEDFLKQSYIIPEYQRDFAWVPSNQTDFYLESVLSSMRHGSRTYSLGDVIVHKEITRDEMGTKITTNYLVDGQQRTTVQVLTLICLRDCIQRVYDETALKKEQGKEYHDMVTRINNILVHKLKDANGEDTVEYVLLSSTRPEFNEFLIYLYNNVGKTFNPKELEETYKDCADSNVKNALANIKFIQEQIRDKYRGMGEDYKRKVIKAYVNIASAVIYIMIQGIVELTNGDKAKEAYYIKNMTGMPMSTVEAFRFMIIAENTPKEERVKYGELWNAWVDKYAEYATSKQAGGSFGLLSLVRSNLKAKYTEFGSTHSGANENVLCNALRNTALNGNEALGIAPNSVFLAYDLEKFDKFLDLIKDIDNSRFSDDYRRDYTFLRLAAGTAKWQSALLMGFDLFGNEFYKVIDKFMRNLVDIVIFMMNCKDTTNMSLVDDLFDILVCDMYRQNMKTPFKDVYQFVETVSAFTKDIMVQKDGRPITAATLETAWYMPCNKKIVNFAVCLTYEYLNNPKGFYNLYKGKEISDFEVYHILEKSGVNLDSGNFYDIHKSRWSCILVNAATFKKNKIYKNAVKEIPMSDTKSLLSAEAKLISPHAFNLWMQSIGLKGNGFTQGNVKEYGNSMKNLVMRRLSIIA